MEELTVRLVPFEEAGGPFNMAADEWLLRQAVRGQPSLRFYGWTEPTLSLGYFQPEGGRREDPLLASLPWLRRASGGLALVHDQELTYCLAVPAVEPWWSQKGWLRFHAIIRLALAGLGVETEPFAPPAPSVTDPIHPSGHFLCFLERTPGDLVIGEHKVVGSAQRKQRGGLMQHGGILLAESRFTPTLPGIHELAGRTIAAETLAGILVRKVTSELGWRFRLEGWSPQEREAIEELGRERYQSPEWNQKR